jgi:deoxyribose-phosphate aldolase
MDITQKIADYSLPTTDDGIDIKVDTALESNSIKYNWETLALCFSMLDYTSLNTTDNHLVIESLLQDCKQVLNNNNIPNIAAICVFPNYIEYLAKNIDKQKINIASVTGGFPTSQTLASLKFLETQIAIENGCNEVDYVMQVGEFLSGNYQEVHDDIHKIANLCHDNNAKLKLIIECGELNNYTNIFYASIIALIAGADFIKTSTGKVKENASFESAYVMAEAICQFNKLTGEKRGIKIAGGIRSISDLIKYLKIISYKLGTDWLNNKLCRFGSSKLFHTLLEELKQ